MRIKLSLIGCFLCIFLVPGISAGAVINGGFEGDFSGWTVGGNAAVVTTALISGVPFNPVEGGKMAALTYPAMVGYIWDNFIYQDVLLEADDHYLNFSFLFWTLDEAPFDTPGFLVEINSQTWFSMDSSDVGDGTLGTLDYTDWISLSIPVEQYYSPARPVHIRISFSAGNSGDNQYPSGAFVDGVSITESNLYPIVPIPSALLLLASGFLGLAGVRCGIERQKKQAP